MRDTDTAESSGAQRAVVRLGGVTLLAVLTSMLLLAIDIASSPPDPNTGGWVALGLAMMLGSALPIATWTACALRRRADSRWLLGGGVAGGLTMPLLVLMSFCQNVPARVLGTEAGISLAWLPTVLLPLLALGAGGVLAALLGYLTARAAVVGAIIALLTIWAMGSAWPFAGLLLLLTVIMPITVARGDEVSRAGGATSR
jgi:hypothetical protein